MKKAPKQTGLKYSLLNPKVRGEKIEGLCSSVIYGPNAAGKTNIIGAMDVLRAIMLRGHIRNVEEETSYNSAAFSLELIPNSSLKKAKPIEFSIEFVADKKLIRYSLCLDLGLFLDEKYEQKIISEELLVNNNLVISRKDKVTFGNLSGIRKYLLKSAKSDLNNLKNIISDSLIAVFVDIDTFYSLRNCYISPRRAILCAGHRPMHNSNVKSHCYNRDELFLTNGFRLIISPAFVAVINEWLTDKFIVITRADAIHLVKKFTEPKKNALYVEKRISRAAEIFGVKSSTVGYLIREDDQDAKLC